VPAMNTLTDPRDRPAKFLVENISLLPKGRVLDVATGDGRNAIYLANLGFQAEGVDISPEAIHKAQESARAQGVTLDARVVDLEKDPYIQPEHYDVIICFRYLQRSLIPYMKNGLRSGGIVVYETYTIDQIQFGKPKNPDFLLKPNELLNLFRDFHIIKYHEGIFEDKKAVAGIIARKPERS
jgi:tellurite methyltransferase